MNDIDLLAILAQVMDVGGIFLALYILFRDRLRSQEMTERYLAFLEVQNAALRAAKPEPAEPMAQPLVAVASSSSHPNKKVADLTPT